VLLQFFYKGVFGCLRQAHLAARAAHRDL